ncbi:MAG: Crp/Fnr family transcriptional regulator [Oscillospiraceae bacterium]|nr:Crp/Fnr family transcriptional regulator [Oscillospiraceae bacterium]
MKRLEVQEEDVRLAMKFMREHMIWSCAAPALLEETLRRESFVESYDKGEEIWNEEKYRQAFGLVLEGAARVRKDRLPLSVHRAGDYFGLVTLYYPSGYYAAEIEAVMPSRILFLPREAIDRLLDACPEAAKRYIAYLSQRVYYLAGRLDAVTAGTAARRLECYLRAMAEPDGAGRCRCDIPSFTALAKALNMGRATLYRALEELAEQGTIKREGKTIELRQTSSNI